MYLRIRGGRLDLVLLWVRVIQADLVVQCHQSLLVLLAHLVGLFGLVVPLVLADPGLLMYQEVLVVLAVLLVLCYRYDLCVHNQIIEDSLDVKLTSYSDTMNFATFPVMKLRPPMFVNCKFTIFVFVDLKSSHVTVLSH